MSANSSTPESLEKKAHPWRRCPMGKHFVHEHAVRVQPNKKNSKGAISIRHEHCAANRSHKDELSYDEIQYITNTYFSSLKGLPTAGLLTRKFDKADNYDVEIRGWVKYWNDIFHPEDPLDPNLIKALIATESSFDIDPKPNDKAHGLMQILNSTLGYLRDTKGELNNYLVCLMKKDLLNPSANICAGVRWLFRKRETAASKLKGPATWINAIEDYKCYLAKILDNEPYNHKPMEDIKKYYEILQGNEKDTKEVNASHFATEFSNTLLISSDK